MRIRYISVVLLLAACVAGCQAPIIREDSVSRAKTLDKLLAENEYSQALQRLPALHREHKDYQQREQQRARVLAMAGAYERQQVKLAYEHRKKNKWAEAVNILNDAHAKYKEGRGIEKTRIAILKQRSEYLDNLGHEANISRAMCLMNELPWREKRANIDPDDRTAQWELDNLRKEIRSTVGKLIECGKVSISRNELVMAKKCLQQARNMKPAAQDLASIRSLENRLASKQKQHSLKRQQTAGVQQEATHMKSTFREHIQRRDFIRARAELDQINTLVPDDKEIPRLEQLYRSELDIEVRNIINTGSVLYRQEKILLAKRTWETALEIDPNNKEVIELIERADRVLNKLEEIRGSE
jgi:tetratricopeptide (TPR) repeat protein